ncbi:hydroxyacid dehydrogenase [Paenibacillus sp. GCM10027626]|uniref:hydroxyacid dehydrogenase n=1 Tax=Paenibacillus sp. GCM10027626 TaxID=3273411 RepID=UPI00363911FF
MKIAILQGKDGIDRCFTSRHLQQLEQYGEIVLNLVPGSPSVERVKELIARADVAITSWGCPPLSAEILEQAPNLQLVLHAAGTVKPIVTPELWERGIRVTNGTEPLGKGVAETALGFLISALKDMWRLAARTRSGEWGGITGQVRELYDLKVGVVSAGRAGRHLVSLLQAFDVEVLVYDPMLSAEEVSKLGATKVALEQLLQEADAISIHAPMLPETERMFNKERFALMKDDCILINTARGTLIDEDDLAAELRKGRFFACVDVTNPEPPAADHPLRQLPNVVLTPHIAGAVNNGLQRIGQYMVEELKLYLEGKPMRGEVRAEQMGILA